MYSGKSAAVLFLLLLLASLTSLKAQTETNNLWRFTTAPQFDGRIQDTAWESIPALDLTVYEPVYKGPKTEETIIKIAYDESYIYVAAKFDYKEIQNIRSNTLYRDEYNEDDILSILVDPFNDNENALWFYINPDGVRSDNIVLNDAEGTAGSPVNINWNAYWDAKTVRTNDGWEAEIRIPFSTIGLQSYDEESEIGIIAYRFMANGRERHIFPDIKPDWQLGHIKPSQAKDFTLSGVKSSKPLYFTPYVLGGAEKIASLNNSQTAYQTETEATYEAGFDLKYNITSNLTLDGSFNTDFAQVEADEQQINLSRVPLFFPEKRQFFQERSSIFDFGLANNDRLFFSRRIGLDNTGQPIRLWGGARVTGKVDTWDVGFLSMQTDDSQNLPSENFTVLRLRNSLFNTNSFLGGMVTSRIGSDGSENIAYGVDASLNITGNEFVTAKLTQTVVQNSANYDPLHSGYYFLDWARRTNNGFYYQFQYARTGRDYNPGIGFLARKDYTFTSGRLSYAQLVNGNSPIRRWDINISSDYDLRNTDGSVESGDIFVYGALFFKSGSFFGVSANHAYEDVLSPISLLPKTSIPAGEYHSQNINLSYNFPSFYRFRPSFNATFGSFYDGEIYRFRFRPTWLASRFFQLNTFYDFTSLRFEQRNERFDSHLARIEAQVALNTKLSAKIFSQYSNVSELIGTNLRIRYNFGEGKDLWLVYNEQLNSDREPMNNLLPRKPFSSARVVLVKFSYSFNLNS